MTQNSESCKINLCLVTVCDTPVFFCHFISAILDIVGLFLPVRVPKNPCLTWRPISHLVLSLHLDFSVMDSVPLDFAVTEFVPQGTFFTSYRAPSVPAPISHLFPISIVRITNWLISLYSLNLVYFVRSIVLVETS